MLINGGIKIIEFKTEPIQKLNHNMELSTCTQKKGEIIFDEVE